MIREGSCGGTDFQVVQYHFSRRSKRNTFCFTDWTIGTKIRRRTNTEERYVYAEKEEEEQV
jgi:hypothetical protein